MDFNKMDLYSNKHYIDVITTAYKAIYYFSLEALNKRPIEVIEFRGNPLFNEIISTIVKTEKEKFLKGAFDNIIIYEEDCPQLWTETYIPYIIEKLQENAHYYVPFRAYIEGKLHYFLLKYSADRINGELKGFIVAIVDNGDLEREKIHHQEHLFNAIDNAERIIMEKTAELRERTLALSFANSESIDLLSNIVEFRNAESGLHIKRVKAFTKVLANQVMFDYPEYNLTPEIVDTIVSASSLHDVGKIMIPDSILLKPGKLTKEEFDIMKKHCEYGIEVLKFAPKSWSPQYIKMAMEICTYHHEKWDGNGYPNGLAGDNIPISAQIVSVADCYDALTAERCYKPAYSAQAAFEMIINGECGSFSDKIISCLKKCKDRFEKIIADPSSYREYSLVQLTGEEKLKGLRILLVDDSIMNLEIDSDILKSEGAEVVTAVNGLEAVEKYTTMGHFDAIIMDIIMPKMDGIEATKKIREFDSAHAMRTPIIALSSEGTPYSTLLEAGIDAYIAKPLIIGELTRILISCMHNSSIHMQHQLKETLKIANTDTLTKVKNIAAYVDTIASLNNEIATNPKLEFSLILTDINDLKICNDTCGHEIGDVYIKNCCKALCKVFSHSPVYRVGGDEFIVVLQGTDYVDRYKKMETLLTRVAKAEKIDSYLEGKVSIAVGMSDFIHGVDTDAHEVQTRADKEMYVNKRKFKEMRKK